MNQNETKVIVFSAPWCGFCRMAKAYLQSKKVEFNEVDVDQDQTAAMFIFSKTGQAGVPVIQIGDEFILGFDRERIDGALRDKKLIN